MKKYYLAGFTLAASLATVPALAPASALAASTNYSGSAATHPSSAAAPSQNNPLLTDDGSVRIGKMIGTNVYNAQDQKLGSVDGVVINKAGEPKVIVSHDNKLVEVQWSDMKFGNAQQNGDNKVIMPSMTKDQLNSMQAFHYTGQHNG